MFLDTATLQEMMTVLAHNEILQEHALSISKTLIPNQCSKSNIYRHEEHAWGNPSAALASTYTLINQSSVNILSSVRKKKFFKDNVPLFFGLQDQVLYSWSPLLSRHSVCLFFRKSPRACLLWVICSTLRERTDMYSYSMAHYQHVRLTWVRAVSSCDGKNYL